MQKYTVPVDMLLSSKTKWFPIFRTLLERSEPPTIGANHIVKQNLSGSDFFQTSLGSHN